MATANAARIHALGDHRRSGTSRDHRRRIASRHERWITASRANDAVALARIGRSNGRRDMFGILVTNSDRARPSAALFCQFHPIAKVFAASPRRRDRTAGVDR